jgi:hypothetical protein
MLHFNPGEPEEIKADENMHIVELLQLLKDTYLENYRKQHGLCRVIEWLRFEEFINEQEEIILTAYLEENKPQLNSKFQKYWFAVKDVHLRSRWLQRHINIEIQNI